MKALLYGFWSIAAKEVLHLRRDVASLVIALLIPVVQLTLFGFAINLDIRYIPMVVLDLDHSREGRQYLTALANTHYLEITSYVRTPDEAEAALRSGSARVAVIIPPDFSRRCVPGQTPVVRVLIDGSDNIVATNARLAFLPRPQSSSTGTTPLDVDLPPAVDARVNMLFNPQMRTATFMIPGLIAVILQIVTVALTSFSLVREREQGTLEQLMVSPVGRLGLMLGKLAPYAVLAFVEMIAVVFLGWLVFDVQVAGSLPLLLLLSIPFIVAALSIGLLISTIAQNQGQALQMTMLIMLPSILMSGFMFPRDTMPGVLYMVSNVLPVTYFMQIVRGIIVRGAGFADLWPSVAALLLITVILLTISTSRFRKSVG